MHSALQVEADAGLGGAESPSGAHGWVLPGGLRRAWMVAGVGLEQTPLEGDLPAGQTDPPWSLRAGPGPSAARSWDARGGFPKGHDAGSPGTVDHCGKGAEAAGGCRRMLGHPSPLKYRLGFFPF